MLVEVTHDSSSLGVCPVKKDFFEFPWQLYICCYFSTGISIISIVLKGGNYLHIG